MPTHRSILLGLVLMIAIPAAAREAAYSAPVLPDVEQHLQTGRREVQKRPDVAVAHAQVVLIGDEVSYRVVFDRDVPEAWREMGHAALRGAVTEWETALHQDIRFVPTESEDAQVTVRFRRDVYLGGEPVAGYARWRRQVNLQGDRVLSARTSADLQIRTRKPDGKAMPVAAMTHEVMHEMGHVLGLEDTDHHGCVMSALTIDHPVKSPLPTEAETVLNLRIEARRIKSEANIEAK